MDRESEEAVKRFIEAAREYIDLVDRHEELGREKFLFGCLRVLPLVFHYAVQLPNVEPDTTGTCERERMIEFERFRKFVGDLDISYQVWDPIGEDDVTLVDGESESIPHSLSDDLLDIYYDLKNPIQALDKNDGKRINDAIWEWRFAFQNHYGQHLASALKALYWRGRYGF